jgi:hypothetical protein
VCGIAVNEVEAFVMENRSLSFIETQIENDVCGLISGSFEIICDSLIKDLPEIVRPNKRKQTTKQRIVAMLSTFSNRINVWFFF